VRGKAVLLQLLESDCNEEEWKSLEAMNRLLRLPSAVAEIANIKLTIIQSKIEALVNIFDAIFFLDKEKC
jgi:hypothetical protein